MNSIHIERIDLLKYEIINWLKYNINSEYIQLHDLFWCSLGWRFYVIDSKTWGIDIEDDEKAVEFKLRFL